MTIIVFVKRTDFLEYDGIRLTSIGDTSDTAQQTDPRKQEAEVAVPFDSEKVHSSSEDAPVDINEAVNRLLYEPEEPIHEQTLAITPYV
jgi:hypothetical protein